MTLRNANRPAGLLLRTSLILLAALIVAVVAPAASRAQSCTPPVTSIVACENQQPGADPLDWEVTNEGDEDIQGYATSMSVNKGETISFKVKSTTPNYKIDIYRLGYYGGDGRAADPGRAWPRPAPQRSPSARASPPPGSSTAATGTCRAPGPFRARRSPASTSPTSSATTRPRPDVEVSQTVFVVRDDASSSDVLYQTSDADVAGVQRVPGVATASTPARVCPDGNPRGYKAAYKVSYNRPLTDRARQPGLLAVQRRGVPDDPLARAERLRRLLLQRRRQPQRAATLLKNHKLFMSSGHDEYWSADAARERQGRARRRRQPRVLQRQRDVLEDALRAQRRRPGDAPTARSSPTRTRTSTRRVDPVSWTGTWRDPRFSAAEHQPENALTGQSFVVNSGTSRITVPYAYRHLRMWRNTAAVSLTPARASRSPTTRSATSGTRTPTTASGRPARSGSPRRPSAASRPSSTTAARRSSTATATHNLTMYRAPSGARVFGAGTVQWAWGLDDWNRTAPARPQHAAGDGQPVRRHGRPARDPRVGPGRPRPRRPTPPRRRRRSRRRRRPWPTARRSRSPAPRPTPAAAGRPASRSPPTAARPGTPRRGTTSWTYSWIAHGTPTDAIKVRATDDSGNIETPAAGAHVNVNCPCSICANSTPTLRRRRRPDAGRGRRQVQVRRPSAPSPASASTRRPPTPARTSAACGRRDGTRLAQATFSSETASGWQTVTFASRSRSRRTRPTSRPTSRPTATTRPRATTSSRMPAPGPNGGCDRRQPAAARAAHHPHDRQRRLRLRRLEHVPDQLLRRGQLLGRRRRSRRSRRPGAVTNVSARARAARPRRTSRGPRPRPAARRPPTRSRRTSARPRRRPRRSPARRRRRATTVTGLTDGHDLHVHASQAINPNGSGPASAQSNAVTPLDAVAPVRADAASRRRPRRARRDVTWTAPEADGDSAITGYTVTPVHRRDGADADAGRRLGDAARR